MKPKLSYCIFIIFAALLISSQAGLAKEPHQSTKTTETVLKTVDCWYAGIEEWPAQECFDMHVPEDHSKPDGRTITFPVLIVRNPQPVKGRAPLIHLGAGGPGSSMYLDSAYAVEVLLKASHKLWLDQGRDFIVIDPRGSGLAKPLLTCDTFIENVETNLLENLSLKQAHKLSKTYYLDCIKDFKSEGIHLPAYNSLSVAKDVEMLRKTLGIKQWILYGVSHAATYAQLIANDYPNTISKMLLDSATFPNLKPHHVFPEYTLAAYEALYDYCEKNIDCDSPLENIEERFWALHKQLNQTPINTNVPHPGEQGKDIPVLLNGNLFINVILNGLYGKQIFSKVPKIITGLEKGDADIFVDNISWYLAYLLDDRFGDISSIAHHCYETKPFTDYELIAQKALQLPEGYIRESALLAQEWHDVCEHLDMEKSNPKVVEATKTDIPTLFLHGKFDTITPLKHVEKQLAGFSNSQLRTFRLSHGIFGIDPCADEMAAAFLLDPGVNLDHIRCAM